MAEDDIKANIGNYKGVMLCARPNENIMIMKEKPFISRVDPKESLGINPIHKFLPEMKIQRVNPALQRHKQWLEKFKEKIQKKKQEVEEKELKEKEKYERLRNLATLQREQLRSDKTEYDNTKNNLTNDNANEQKESPLKESSTEQNVKEIEEGNKPNDEKKTIDSDSPKKTKTKKGKKKPKWAMTEKELKEKEDAEVDYLLNFAENLDYDKYIGDLEVKNMLAALKKKIEELKQEEDWRAKLVQEWNDDDKKSNGERKIIKLQKTTMEVDNANDTRSVISEGKSVASEKTHKSIQSIKEQMEKKEQNKQDDWDKSTTAEKKQVSLGDRLAKHIADEILRNNTNIRMIHSNNSIRKILEKEARKQIQKFRSSILSWTYIKQECTLEYEEKFPYNFTLFIQMPQ